MKRKYASPDFEITSLTLRDTLAASNYSAEPEDPTRNGNDSGGGGLDEGLTDN